LLQGSIPNKIIRILLIRNSYPKFIDIKEYSDVMTNYIQNNGFREYSIEYSYCEPKNLEPPIIKAYENRNSDDQNYIKPDRDFAVDFDCIIYELKNNKYDMAILDDRFLFGDRSYLKNILFAFSFNYGYIDEYLVHLDKYKKGYNLDFNDKSIVEGGYLDKKFLVGLPYEADFGLRYGYFFPQDIQFMACWDNRNFNNKNNNNNNNVNNISNTTANKQVKRNDASPANGNASKEAPKGNANNLNKDSHPNLNNGDDQDTPMENNNASNIHNNQNTNNNIGDNNSNTNSTSSTNDGFKPPEEVSEESCKKYMEDLMNKYRYFYVAGFKDNDVMFDFFVENMIYQLSFPKPDKPDYYDKLDQSRNFYNYFREIFFLSYRSNINNYIDEIMTMSDEEAYNLFLEKEKTTSYKGKASYFRFLKEKTMANNDQLGVFNPVGGVSVLTKKYLVINKNSKKIDNIDELAKMAFQLTSERAQMERAQNFGMFPTFDFNQVESNPIIKMYNQSYPEISKVRKEARMIDVKSLLYKNKYSPSLAEMRLVLPDVIKEYIYTKNPEHIMKLFSNFYRGEESGYFFIKPRQVSSFVIIGCIYLVIIVLIAAIVLTIRKRNNPYIRAISPVLSCLSILGLIFLLIYPNFSFLIKESAGCHAYSLTKFFICNVIF